MTITYKSAGVDVAAGDDASKILFDAAKQTWSNRQGLLGEIHAQDSGFRTSRYFEVPNQSSDLCFGMNFDGIGSKIEFAERLNDYRGLARDLIAMVSDDAAVQGAEPIHVGSILDMAKVEIGIVRELALGMVEAAAIARVAVINGELAELPGRITGYGTAPINWGGACFWAARKDKLKEWQRPVAGDVIVGVEEIGFRSNGFSLLRAIFRKAYGDSWPQSVSEADRKLISFASRPSTIYTPFVLSLTGGIQSEFNPGLRGLIHVTGGGLVGRLRYWCRHHHLGATVNSPIQPPPEVLDIIRLGRVEIPEAYKTWNMGTGLAVVCASSAADGILKNAIDHGLHGAVIGSLTSDESLSFKYFDGHIDTRPITG